MSWLLPALVWCLLPKSSWRVLLLCLVSLISWPAAGLLGVFAWALEKSQRKRRQVGHAQRCRQVAIYWVEILHIQTVSGVPLIQAMNSANRAWQKAYPDLGHLCPHPDWDLEDQCRWLAGSSIPLWVQVGQGLARIRKRGTDPNEWLGQLIDEHYRSQDESRQSKAAALGSKLLMPLILGALPQGFLIIGFVVLNGELSL